jgi:hypothetical protein
LARAKAEELATADHAPAGPNRSEPPPTPSPTPTPLATPAPVASPTAPASGPPTDLLGNGRTAIESGAKSGPGNAVLTAAQQQPSSGRDAIEWNKIKGSSDPAAFENFIQRFPNGPLAINAQRKLDVLRQAQREREAAQKAAEEARVQAEQKKPAEAAAKEREEEKQRAKAAEAEQKAKAAEEQAGRRLITSGDSACRDRMRMLGVVSNGPCIDVSDIVDNLAKGDYVFNDPKRAYVDERFTVRLVLKTFKQQDVRDRFVGLPGDVTSRLDEKFAQSLEATLHGDDFAIEPSSPQARTATMAAPVEWEWNVRAQSGGQKLLVVEVVANIQAGPDKHRVQITTLNEPLLIEVSTLYRIKTYFAGVGSAVAQLDTFTKAVVAAIPTLVAFFGFVPKARNWLKSTWRGLRKKRSSRSPRRKSSPTL